MQSKFAKIAALTVGVTFALGLSVNTAGAQTIAELQAQINALMAQLAALSGGTAPAATVTFTADMTVGSTGSQVVALQQMLVAQGHLVMPAGVAYGYFGSLTRAAVMKWQAANGVPSTGYFGPMSRAKANASATGTVPGTTVGTGTTTGGGITTPGVEGILSATLAPVPGAGASVEEGDEKVKVLGIELEADLSDVKIERIKVKLDQTTTATNDRDFYRDIAERMYVMDGSTVLASVDLNSSTVIEETSGNYYVTITGLNYVVKKDTKKTLTIAIDAQSSWDSEFDDDTWTVTIPAEGIRGVDGAGLNLYAPASGSTLARTFNTDPASADTATLTVSLNADTPDDAQFVADEGSDEDEIDGVELIRFNAKADDDDVTITDVVVSITRGGNTSTATATTAYLYHGSTQVGSATVSGTSATAMTATFDDLEIVVDEDDTETFSVKVDIIDAGSAATTFLVGNVAVTAENSQGDSATVSGGSADGNTITILSAGPEFTLVSKSITKTSNDTNSTAKATFNVRVTAVGGDVVASTTGAFDIEVFENGTASSTIGVLDGVYNTPSGATVSGDNITIAEGSSVTFVVDALTTVTVSGNTAKFYAFGIQDISMNNATFNFMEDDVDWRTDTVVLP